MTCINSFVPSLSRMHVTWAMLNEIAVNVQKKYYPYHPYGSDLIQEAIVQTVAKLAVIDDDIASPRAFIFVLMRNIMSNYSYYMSKMVVYEEEYLDAPYEPEPIREREIDFEVSKLINQVRPLMTTEQVSKFKPLVDDLITNGTCSPRSIEELSRHESRIFILIMYYIKLMLMHSSRQFALEAV